MTTECDNKNVCTFKLIRNSNLNDRLANLQFIDLTDNIIRERRVANIAKQPNNICTQHKLKLIIKTP